MTDDLQHHGVKGMKWKQHTSQHEAIKPKSRWGQSTTPSSNVSTASRTQLVKQLRLEKRLTGVKTKGLSKLSTEMMRNMLNSDLMKKKMSELSPAKKERAKKVMGTIFKAGLGVALLSSLPKITSLTNKVLTNLTPSN